jgi:hypothetical protein
VYLDHRDLKEPKERVAYQDLKAQGASQEKLVQMERKDRLGQVE